MDLLNQADIATVPEIFRRLTEIMRSTPEDGVKLSDSMSAADKLYKMLRDAGNDEGEEKKSGIVILPEIKYETGDEGDDAE